MELSLREIKKARSKIALYEACLGLIGNGSFREVKLEEICARAEVSKVTFFKFFPQKEDILVYFMNVWMLERMLEMDEQKLRGAQGIRHILHCVAESSGERPGLMLSLIGFLSEQRMHPCMPVLSDAEFHILFSGQEEQAKSMSVNMFALFHRLIEEARMDGECRREEPTAVLTQWLVTIFYGAYLTAHMCALPIGQTYESHLSLLLFTKKE